MEISCQAGRRGLKLSGRYGKTHIRKTNNAHIEQEESWVSGTKVKGSRVIK